MTLFNCSKKTLLKRELHKTIGAFGGGKPVSLPLPRTRLELHNQQGAPHALRSGLPVSFKDQKICIFIPDDLANFLENLKLKHGESLTEQHIVAALPKHPEIATLMSTALLGTREDLPEEQRKHIVAAIQDRYRDHLKVLDFDNFQNRNVFGVPNGVSVSPLNHILITTRESKQAFEYCKENGLFATFGPRGIKGIDVVCYSKDLIKTFPSGLELAWPYTLHAEWLDLTYWSNYMLGMAFCNEDYASAAELSAATTRLKINESSILSQLNSIDSKALIPRESVVGVLIEHPFVDAQPNDMIKFVCADTSKKVTQIMNAPLPLRHSPPNVCLALNKEYFSLYPERYKILHKGPQNFLKDYQGQWFEVTENFSFLRNLDKDNLATING